MSDPSYTASVTAIDPSTAIGVVIGVAIGLAFVGAYQYLVFPLVAIVHERTHEITMDRLGYQYRTTFDGPVIGDRVWPTRGGAVEPAPTVTGDAMSSLEILAVALAPLSLTVATAPIPAALAIAADASVVEFAGLVAIWSVMFAGPSIGDWHVVAAELRGRSEFDLEPAIGADAPHVVAEGITVDGSRR